PPVDQVDWVDDRDHCARSDLHHAADIAGGDHVGPELFDIADFALAQPPRKLRLENVERAGRTAAQMSFWYIFHDESHLAKQFFRRAYNFLTVLKRAGRMVGDHKARRGALGCEVDAAQILADVPGKPRHAERLLGVGAIGAQHITVILDGGAAARSGDKDGIEAVALHLRGQRIDLAPGG